jgi:hypothetical protein
MIQRVTINRGQSIWFGSLDTGTYEIWLCVHLVTTNRVQYLASAYECIAQV